MLLFLINAQPTLNAYVYIARVYDKQTMGSCYLEPKGLEDWVPVIKGICKLLLRRNKVMYDTVSMSQ